MRLTLRTLLSYLYDVLDAPDAKDIGARVQESEYASSVVLRIRDITRRPRLGAPKLHGRSAGLDPNTVGEYLDNVLANDRVADFEKVCLESDIHLAEVASCQEIVPKAFAELPEIVPSARQRMYQLLSRHDEELKHARDAVSEYRRLKREQSNGSVAQALEPERESASWAGWVVAALAVLVLVGGGVLMVVNPPWWQRLLSGGTSVAVNGTSSSSSSVSDAGPADVTGNQSTTEPADTGRSGASTAATAADTEPAPTTDPLEQPTDAGGLSTTPANNEPAAGVTPSGENPPMPTPPPVAEKEVLGQLVSHTPMFRFDGAQWRLMPILGTLASGDLLISPPAFRNSFTVRGGVTVYLLGDSQLQLRKAEADKLPLFELRFGRIVVTTAADTDTRLRIRAGEHEALVTLRDAASTLAVEVRPQTRYGEDPVKQPKPLIVEFHAAVGQIQIAWLNGERVVDLVSPARYTQGAEQPVQGEPPIWITRDDLTQLEKQAVEKLHEELRRSPGDRSLSDALHELLGHNRPEVQALAMRSLASIGLVQPLTAALNDEKQVRHWQGHIEMLRRLVNLDATHASMVREALERQRASEGAGLFRMLWGYSNEDLLKRGEASRLVEYLDHPSLDYRVLASWNLREITGDGRILYRPEGSDAQRRPYVIKWKQRLESGQIVHAHLPIPKVEPEKKPLP